MPARRSSAVAQAQVEADQELAADAPAKVRAANRPVRAVSKADQTEPKAPGKTAKAQAKAKVAKKEAAPKAKGPEFKKLTPAAVRPRQFKSTLIPIDAITGWESIGDPPPDDFIDDIRRNGLEIPVVVDAVEGEDGETAYQIVEGKRRLRAFQVLTEEGIEGFENIPAVINPRRNQRDLRLRSLSANYQRGENVTGDARTVKDLMTAGYKDKQIAEASGTPIATIRVLRDIAFKLHPTLFEATEQNKMKPWTAKEASRLGLEGQARLIKQLELNDRVTSDDAIEARRFRVIQAADSALPKDMFDGDAELPYDDEETPVKANRDEMFVKAEPKKGKTGADHVFNARRAATIAKLELEKLKPANRTSREQAALDSILDAIRLLDGEDEIVLEVTALDAEELEEEELDDEELNEDDDEEEEDDEELDDEDLEEEEEEENPF